MDYSEYSIAFNACAGLISIGLLSIHYTRKELHGASHHAMAALLSTMIVASFLYMTLFIYQWIPNPYGGETSATFWVTITLLFHNVVPFLFALYAYFLTGQTYRPRKHKWLFVITNILLTLPVLANFVLIFINISNPLILKLDSDGYLHVYPGRYWLLGTALFYIAYVVFLISRYHSSLRKPQLIAMIVAVVIQTTMLIFQLTFLNGLNMDLLTCAFACASIMFTSEDRLAVKDTKTSAFNRDAFYFHTKSALYAKNNFRIIVAKLENYEECASLVGSERVDDVVAKIVDELRRLAIPSVEYFLYRPDVLVMNSYSLKDENHHRLLDALQTLLQRDYQMDNVVISLAAEVSYVHVPRDVGDIDSIIRLIELPANLEGKRFALVRDERLKENERKSRVADALLRGIQNHSFEVHYFPIYDVTQAGVAGCEALARLTDPELGAIGPAEFIPVAEQIGVITKIGRIVFEQVCQDFSRFDFLRYGVDFVIINISLRQFLEPDLPYFLNRDMFTYHMTSENVVFHVSGGEDELFRHANLYPASEGVRKLGIPFTVGHYGLGGQSFLMDELPFDIRFIAIDYATVKQAGISQRSDLFLRSQLDLIEKYGMTAIAEGVETEATAIQMKSMGVRYLMGFYYARPMPAEAFIAYCASHRRRRNAS